MRIVSLFSGAGGLDLGMILSGHSIIWAIDNDEDAVSTYKRNIGNHIICQDIEEVQINDIPDCDVVVGGFPCQGFSIANTRRSVEDKRNILYTYFHSIVVGKRPKYFLAENVKGMLSLEKGAIMKQIVKDFSTAGYYVKYKLFNLADYGIPQSRQRVIIVGRRIDINDYFDFIFPCPTHAKQISFEKKQWISIKDAIDFLSSPNLLNVYPNMEYSSYKLNYRNFTGHRETDPKKPSPTILARGNGKGGVCAIPHYNGKRRLSIRESATIQTFPLNFEFVGAMNSCYRQIGNAVPVLFAQKLGEELHRLELLKEIQNENSIAI